MILLIILVIVVLLFLARPLISKLLMPVLRPIFEKQSLKSNTVSTKKTHEGTSVQIYDESIEPSGNFATDLKNQHNAKKKTHMINLEHNDLSRIMQVAGEVDYLRRHPSKLNTSSFNALFKQYLDCFLWLDDQLALDDVILSDIEKILDTYNYLELNSLEGHAGVAIKSAFLCALVSGSNNNIRGAYMRGKNSSHDKRFVAKRTDQEYSAYMYDQYPIIAMAIEKIEPKRQKAIMSTMGYVLYGEY